MKPSLVSLEDSCFGEIDCEDFRTWDDIQSVHNRG